jgi:CO dehydrogenase/acetyl-CoA synthase delta subunit
MNGMYCGGHMNAAFWFYSLPSTPPSIPAAQFEVSDLGRFSLAEMLETNYHDEAFCEWAKTCPVGAKYDGGGEPCARVS